MSFGSQFGSMMSSNAQVFYSLEHLTFEIQSELGWIVYKQETLHFLTRN